VRLANKILGAGHKPDAIGLRPFVDLFRSYEVNALAAHP
jgi:hypothetical protein